MHVVAKIFMDWWSSLIFWSSLLLETPSALRSAPFPEKQTYLWFIFWFLTHGMRRSLLLPAYLLFKTGFLQVAAFYVDPLTAFRRASTAGLSQFQGQFRGIMDNHNFLKPPSIPAWGTALCPLSGNTTRGRACIKLYPATVKFSVVPTYVKLSIEELSFVQN